MAITPITTTDISDMVVMDPNQLTPVQVGVISEKSMGFIEGRMTAKQCYTNALMAAIALGGEKVIIGATWIERFGIAIEHAWLQMADGTYYDPTLQKLEGTANFAPNTQYQYFALWSVSVDEYLETGARLRGGVTDMAIDTMALRTSPETRHLFNYRRRSAA